ncbi:glycosyltransferase family A protein [Xanthomarina sp. GH4-25]|uniref:glycosyltransferase family A protein n=1 Tax=Xanthomarina sp. GH4-25 TaxID=3349335 RepID=UPI0038782728
MGLSIITPHFDNFEGLKNIYKLLIGQTLDTWEWIIVDDNSSEHQVNKIKLFFKEVSDSRIKLQFQIKKTNASVCRNLGLSISSFNHLVFLDSDDSISIDFVKNRDIDVLDFVVFNNMVVVNENGEHILSKPKTTKYLDAFLNANFLWQTTSVLWQKSFLLKIGAFNTELKRLQDVELVIRALSSSNYFQVKDNLIDFYYHVKPIRDRNNFVAPVCTSVSYFINKLIDFDNLTNTQKHLIRSYYFMCVKYLERSNNRTQVKYVKPVLKMFYKKHYFSFRLYIIAWILLYLFQFNCLSNRMFLKLNRYFFKTEMNT